MVGDVHDSLLVPLPVFPEFILFIFVTEIPEWLYIYSKAPPEHDHKLKVSAFERDDLELQAICM